jgi:hypothetical protein
MAILAQKGVVEEVSQFFCCYSKIETGETESLSTAYGNQNQRG